MKIESSIALVTGANRGIGRAYVEELLKAGAKKIYLGVRNPASVKDLVAKAPDRLIPLKLDVTNAADIQAAVKAADDINLLINNAGILFMDEDKPMIERARQQMEVNYIGPMAMTQAFAPILKKNGGGVMVTVSSIAGHVVFPGMMTYSASKFAAHAFILGARQNLQEQGTRVIGVYPGPIDTDMAKDIPMDKVPPGQVAVATIKAITDGQDDVFPDAFSQGLYQSYRADAKAVERQMLEMAAQGREAA